MALRADDVDLRRDRDLVVRSQAGEDDAFEDLYRRYFWRLYRFCLRRVRDPHEAEELAQETFMRAYRALAGFAGERRFYPWLTVIASRLCVDAQRRRSRTTPTEVVDLGAVGDTSHERLVAAVDAALVTAAMDRLTPRHREVLLMREQEGWSYQHIAVQLGVNRGTVEALLHRARRALRREFEAVTDSDARNAVGVGVLAWAGRRLADLRQRVAGLETAWGPIVGQAVAAAAVVVGAAVSVSPVPPASGLQAGTVAATRPAAGEAGAAAHSHDHDHGHGPAARPSPEGDSATASSAGATRVPTGGVILHGEEARRRAEDQPIGGDDTGGVVAGIDPDAIVDETTGTAKHQAENVQRWLGGGK